jgi:pimeloyl-ACP methyl ester carboxylesterase
VNREPAFQKALDRVAALPSHPRSLSGPSNWLNGVLLFADYLASVPPRMTRLTSGLRKYPPDFRKVEFPSLDGTRLVGWFGESPRAKEGPQPGLLLIPGLFTSKDNNRIRARSVKILRDWGFHILTLDLRGIGESERVYSTPGLKEAEDIVASLAWFRSHANVRPLHLYTESLAAGAALVAVGREGQAGRALVDGRVLSVSPFGDPRPIVQRFSGPGDWKQDRELAGAKAFFRFVLRLSGSGESEFDEYVANGAKHYGIGLDEMYRASTPNLLLPHARSQTLVLHSEDDTLVPVDEVRRLEEKVRGNPDVAVMVLPWGNHCLYEMADPDWYWAALAHYFGAPTSQAAPRP